MLTVALTGGIGCGKTTVCQLFKDLGTPIIDTDLIAHDLVKPGHDALNELVEFFGKEILLADGALNRKALANKTFHDKNKRKYLESVLHPKIRQRVEKQINSLSSPYVIIAIPLLIETSQQSSYKRILVIDCDEKQQVIRTLERDNRSIEEVNSIIKIQVSRDKRLEYADDIINNREDKEFLKQQVSKLHQKYLNLANS